MARHPRDNYYTQAHIVERISPAVFRVQMANGHRLVAHASGALRLNFIRLLPGEKVLLEVSPYDLSRGRLVLPSEAPASPKNQTTKPRPSPDSAP